MKKLSYILTILLIFTSVLPCFAQEKQTIDRIGNWRKDLSCGGMEIGELIETLKDNAIPILKTCCKVHKSACLNFYSTTKNKTLLYTAIESEAYGVAEFLFGLSPNYINHVDDYGLTFDSKKENNYVIIIEPKEDRTSKTPLMLACSKGDLQGAKLLINHSASLLKVNYLPNGNVNKNAFQYAMEAKNTSSVFVDYIKSVYTEQLKKYGKLEKPDDNSKYNKNNQIYNELKRQQIINQKFYAQTENKIPENLL